MSENTSETTKPARKRGRYFIVIVAVVSALSGALLTKVVSYAAHHRFHKHWHQTVDKETAQRRAEKMAGYIARKVDATAEQKSRLVTISKSLAVDLLPYREKMIASRMQAREILLQDKMDREKLEAFRAEKVSIMDAMSKRVSVAIADASEVLSPEQRKKLGERFLRMRR